MSVFASVRRLTAAVGLAVAAVGVAALPAAAAGHYPGRSHEAVSITGVQHYSHGPGDRVWGRDHRRDGRWDDGDGWRGHRRDRGGWRDRDYYRHHGWGRHHDRGWHRGWGWHRGHGHWG